MPRGFGGGGFGRGGFGMRRGGMPLFGMGGMGMGMMGSPLLTGLMGGGIGYMLGSNSANQQASQQVQQGAPIYQQPPQQWTQAPASSPSADVLSQLKLLGQLRDSNVLSEEEFQREKDKVLGH